MRNKLESVGLAETKDLHTIQILAETHVIFSPLISVQREITLVKSMVKYDKSVLFNINKNCNNITYINIVSGTRDRTPSPLFKL